jgi:hypothetical protein
MEEALIDVFLWHIIREHGKRGFFVVNLKREKKGIYLL